MLVNEGLFISSYQSRLFFTLLFLLSTVFFNYMPKMSLQFKEKLTRTEGTEYGNTALNHMNQDRFLSPGKYTQQKSHVVSATKGEDRQQLCRHQWKKCHVSVRWLKSKAKDPAFVCGVSVWFGTWHTLSSRPSE